MSELIVSTPTEDTVLCTGCKRTKILVSVGRKRCPQCRDKSKAYREKRAMKRKAEEGLEATAGIAKRSKIMTDENGFSGSLTATNSVIEYQTATEMYKALKVFSKLKSKHPTFRGCFSIVSKADTDNITRARLVVQELRKIAKIPFQHKKPVNPILGSSSYRTSFKCTCFSVTSGMIPITKLLDPGSKSGNSVQKPGVLEDWAGLKPNNSGVEARTQCDGKVTIIAEADTSHPLGIPGQKISIIIEH